MPVDPHTLDDDSDSSAESEGRSRRFGDFDCPACMANNPYDEKFGDGDEILCYFCGQEYSVQVSDEGRLKLRER